MTKPFYTIQKKNRFGGWDDWLDPDTKDVRRILKEERDTYPEWDFRVIRSEVVEM